MTADVRSVAVRLSARVSGYIADMRRAGVATEQSMDRANASIRKQNHLLAASHQAAHKMGAAVRTGGLLAAGGLALAVKQAADFQSKMALVQTLAHANAREMKQLSDAAKSVGIQYGYTASDVADGEAEMIKAGVSLKDILGGGLKGTLALAAAGQTDVATATTIAASAMTQFGLKGKDIPHIADLLAAGADKALGSVQDLGYGLSQAGTTAHQAGLSVEQTTGTLAAFAQAGLIGEKGGTTFKQMLLQLENPTAKAAGLMAKYNISLYDAAGNIKSMPELAANLQHSLEQLTPAQRNAALGTIFGSRAIQGANILLADGQKQIQGWIDKVNDQGFAAQQASGKLDSLEGDLSKLKATGENAFIALGSGLVQKPLRSFVQDATKEIGKLTKSGDLERWGREIGDTLHTLIDDATPLAKTVGHTLGVVGHGVKTIVEEFNKLPPGVQKAIVTGAVVGVGAHKLGLDSVALAGGRGAGRLLFGGRGSGGLVGTIASKARPVPVFVVNEGFGGGPGGVVGGGEKEAPKIAKRVLRWVPALGWLALPIGFAAFMVAAPGNRKSPIIREHERDIGHPLDPNYARGGRYSEAHYRRQNAETHAQSATRSKVAHQLGLDKSAAGLSRVLDPFALSAKHADKNGQALTETMFALSKQIDSTGLSVHDYDQKLSTLPKQVQTKVLAPGTIDSLADVKKLQHQYDLTKPQVTTLIKLLGGKAALRDIRAVQEGLNLLHNKTIRIRTQHFTSYSGQPPNRSGFGGPRRAGGGPVAGDSTYLVGERGPELYRPKSDGWIYTAAQTQAMRAVPASSAGAAIDYDRLAAAMARARPLYGDVHISPHNYNEFLRQEQQDRARADYSGVG